MTRGRWELFRALGAVAGEVADAGTACAALGWTGPGNAEHTEVFVLNCPPYASVYLGAEGGLGGEGTDRVAGFWRALGLAGARIVFNPSATSRGLSQYLWRLEQPASAVANEYFVGAINRVGIEPLGDNDFYGQTYFVDPRGQLVGDAAADDKDEVVIRDLDMEQLAEVRNLWQFYRDRRPDAYGPLVQP